MYGTTMKHYNVNKASKSKDENSIFSKNIQAKSQKNEKRARDTRYVKIESNAKVALNQSFDNSISNEVSFSRKEFPIPSVIITALATVMLLVVISGLLII